MTYNGVIIEKPTLNIIDQYINKRGYNVQSGKLYSFWNHRNWTKKKGGVCESIEEAVDMFANMFHSEKKRTKKARKRNKTVLQKGKTRFKNHKIDIPYDAQLKDARWYKFRDNVFKLKGKKCMKCGCRTGLQIHHPKYNSGRYAWEYDPEMMMVLCDKCHKYEHGII